MIPIYIFIIDVFFVVLVTLHNPSAQSRKLFENSRKSRKLIMTTYVLTTRPPLPPQCLNIIIELFIPTCPVVYWQIFRTPNQSIKGSNPDREFFSVLLHLKIKYLAADNLSFWVAMHIDKKYVNVRCIYWPGIDLIGWEVHLSGYTLLFFLKRLLL